MLIGSEKREKLVITLSYVKMKLFHIVILFRFHFPTYTGIVKSQGIRFRVFIETNVIFIHIQWQSKRQQHHSTHCGRVVTCRYRRH